jgi:hypothetical protein
MHCTLRNLAYIDSADTCIQRTTEIERISMKKAAVPAVFVVALVVASMTATAFADVSYSIYIQDPNNAANGAHGLSMDSYWVGQIPITITSGATSTQTMAYCMQAERLINIGGTYTATLTTTPDTAAWQAVSYILSWNTPTTNSAAAVDQAAIWRLLNPSYIRESWMDVNIDNQGAALAATASGKDVARSGDHLNWVTPITSNGASTKGNPGQTITFVAQLTDNTGTPRANVKIQFTASIEGQQLNSTYLSASEVYTNSQGVTQVNVQIPSDALLGSTVTVQASTHGVWPQRYVDLTNPDNQDLIAMGTSFDLTLSTNVYILAYIMVLPESALGALSAISAVAAAFIIYNKTHKTTNN